MKTSITFFVGCLVTTASWTQSHPVNTSDPTARELIVRGRPVTRPVPWFAIPTMVPHNALCGAVLIHADILLSAAHCHSAFATAGSVYRGGTQIDGSESERLAIQVQYMRVHPDYDKEGDGMALHDIMLIPLKRLSAATTVRLSTNPYVPFSGQSLTVMGYGRTIPKDGNSTSTTLLQTKVSAIADATCHDALGWPLTRPYHVCVLGYNTGPCRGDSGGPVLTSRGELVGIVSQGRDCATEPTVLTRVSAYQTFIQRGICDLSQTRPASCPSPQKRRSSPPL